MGIINVNIDSGLQSEPFYPSASILEISTRYNETPYFQKIKREPLVFNLTFAFENGFDDDKLRETARWLNQKTFKELYFSNQPDKKYFAIYEGSPRLFHTGADGYFEITFRTNSPYAHSNLIETGIYNQVSPALTFSRPSPAIHPVTGEEIPADTPIFMPFAGDKQGLLMEEGTENLMTETQSSWEMDISSLVIYGNAQAEQSSNWAWHGNYSAKVWDADSSSNRVYVRVPVISDKWSIFSCYVHNPNTSPITVYAMNMVTGNVVVLPGETKRLLASRLSEWSGVFDIRIYANTKDPFFIDGLMFYRGDKNYHLSWHIGGGTRANPTSLLTLPEALPQEFGIGIAVKPLWGKDDPAGDAVWRRCFLASSLDSNDRIGLSWQPTGKRWYAWMRVAGITRYAFLPTTDFNAGDILGFYLERRTDRFRLASKFTGGEIVYTPWASDDRRLSGIKKVHIGGDPSANAILADFTLHDSGDIDPEGYLSRVPGGGV